MSKKEILIAGTGALATLFAAKFSSIGVDVTVLGTWQKALYNLNKLGARTDEGEFPVHATNRPQDCIGATATYVLVKSWQTTRVARQLMICLHPEGFAISLQNGLGNTSVLENVLGTKRVILGVTTVGATMIAPGMVYQSGKGRIWLQGNSRISPLVIMLAEAGFQVDVVDDIMPMMWGKIIINAAINPLTSIIRVKNGELVKNPVMREILTLLVEEILCVMDAHGVKLPFTDPIRAVLNVAQNTHDNYSSMLRDVLRNTRTEIGEINGAILEIGSSLGLSLPINQLVTQLVKERKALTPEELLHLIHLRNKKNSC